MACDDGENKVTVSAFGSSAEKLRSIKLNDLFELTNFQVRIGKPEFGAGSFEEFEIILSETSNVTSVPEGKLPSFPFEWTPLTDIKSTADSTVVGKLFFKANYKPFIINL